MSELLASLRVLLPIRNRERFLTALLGPKCGRCFERVYPIDRPHHDKDCT